MNTKRQNHKRPQGQNGRPAGAQGKRGGTSGGLRGPAGQQAAEHASGSAGAGGASAGADRRSGSPARTAKNAAGSARADRYAGASPRKAKNAAGGSSRAAAGGGRSRQSRPGVHGPAAGSAAGRPGTAPSADYAVTGQDELLQFLLAHMAGKGRNAVKSMLARGQVSVDGQAVTAYNYPLRPGQTVSVSREKAVKPVSLEGLTILYEDEDLIVVNKEAGLLSVAGKDDTEQTAYRQLMEHVRRTHPGNRVFVLHRLDRDTSGVMMFAKSERVQQEMQTAWKDVVKERTYVALVEGRVRKPEGTVSSWLKESSTLKMYSSPHEGDGQHAVTHYKLLQGNRHFTLLEIQLETGRKNQIRVHMSDIGHPVAGDRKYGAQTRTVGRLGLHARLLSFIHPTTGELMTFESPVPKPFLKYTAPEPGEA